MDWIEIAEDGQLPPRGERVVVFDAATKRATFGATLTYGIPGVFFDDRDRVIEKPTHWGRIELPSEETPK